MKRFVSIILTLVMILSFSLSAIPVFAADAWYVGWHRAGTTSTDGDALIITAKGGTSSYITKGAPANLGDQFDVEFTLKMNVFGNQNVQIKTGKHRMMFTLTPATITNAVTNTTAETKTFNFNVGYNTHTYRVIGNNGMAEFYADGYYIGKAQLEQNSASKEIHIWNTSSATMSSEMVLTNVVCRPYTGSLANQSVEDGEDTTKEEPALKPASERIVYNDFNDPNNMAEWNVGAWQIEDGAYLVRNTNPAYKTTKTLFDLYPGENFKLEMGLKVLGISQGQGFQIFWPGHRFDITPQRDYFGYSALSSSSTESVGNLIDDKFHHIVVETYDQGTKVKFSMDGKLLFDGQAMDSTRTDYHIYCWTYAEGGNLSSLAMDWFKMEPISYDLTMEFPYDYATYLEGKEIELQAKNQWREEEPPYVEYKIGDEVVATGKAPDYKTVLTNLRAGSYEITANYEDSTSAPKKFTVVPKVDGELLTNLDGDTLTVSLDLFDKGLANVIEVEYLLDGNSIGKVKEEPYAVTVSGLMPERHNLQAVCRDESGVMLKVLTKTLVPKVGLEGQVSTNYANDITYTVSGDSGSAAVDFSNGTHRVYLVHTPDGVTYLTDTGEETYQVGTGNFEIITDGSVADVYRNGQMVFSYYMPMTDKIDRSISQDGMTVENYKESAPKQKNNYFVKRNVQDKAKTYELSGLPFYSNIDFVAEKDDEVQFVLNDGYYSANVTLKDGKFSIWTMHGDNSEPFCDELADALDGKVYYRVEMSLGMCRLYGNGRWLTSFRALHGGGDGFLFVDVKKGSIDYLGINDNKDLRIFNDAFDGSGTIDSEEFFVSKNSATLVEPDIGRMLILAKDKTNAIAEWNAFAADFDFGANVNVETCTGGFWFILNHSVTQSYSKIGYNFEKGQYEYVEVTGTGTETVKKTEVGSFPLNEDVYLSLSSQKTNTGKEVIMYVNGNPVISVGDSAHRQGTFGFIVNKGMAYVYDVDYRGDAKIVKDLVNNPNAGLGLLQTADMLIGDEGQMVFIGDSNAQRDVSYDGGKTWVKEDGVPGDGHNMVKLNSGELLNVQRKQTGEDETGSATYAYYAHISYDNGDSWEDLGPIHEPKAHRITMQNRLTTGASGRVYFACCENNDESKGHTAIYYSDDKGKTWKKSQPEFKAEEQGIMIAEVVCLETQSGVVRAYIRNDRGFIHYFNSYDYGETFDMTPHRTPFFSALNCYNIERDPETGYLYIAWGYDNVGLSSSNQLPRSRWSVAMSKDDGETWEFIGTCHENNEAVVSTIMNMNINVTPDYLVLSAMSTDSINGWHGRYITIDKDQVASKRFDQVHYFDATGVRAMAVLNEDITGKTMIVNPEDGTMMVRNRRIAQAVDGEKIAIDAAAAFVGATVDAGENGSVLLKRGTSSIEFTRENLTQKDGKQFVNLKDFANEYNLTIDEYEGISVVSVGGEWSDGQLKIFQNILNPAEVL